jgi:hypothetical protein
VAGALSQRQAALPLALLLPRAIVTVTAPLGDLPL